MVDSSQDEARIDEDRLDRALAGWGTHGPPADFADRILVPRRSRRGVGVLAIAAVLCLAIGGWWWGGTGESAEQFNERATVRLGSVGVVVAEPGADLRWSFDRASSVIEHVDGAAFYRFESSPWGAWHRIQTPAGVVESDRGCFSVEVDMKTGVKGALAGAALASAVWLTVHQGTAHSAASDDRPAAVIEAGERIALRAPAPKIDAPRRAATAPQTSAPKIEREPVPAAVIAERDALRAQVKGLKSKLSDQASALEHHLGEAVPFPDDLDPLYREEALMQQHTEALEEIGVDGEVAEIDCSEFPCIVYGKVRGEDGSGLQRMNDTEALQAYGEERGRSSVWGGEVVKDGEPSANAVFGIAAYPKSRVEDGGMLKKRLRLRHQAYWEAEREGLHDSE